MIAKQKVCNKQMIAPWAFYQALSHHPRHGYFDVIKVPMTDQAVQGCHWSGKSQGNSRSGKSQGILEFVREIWNFVESQGNLRKVREIQLKASEI